MGSYPIKKLILPYLLPKHIVMRKLLLLCSLPVLCITTNAQTTKMVAPPPGLSAIRLEDIKKDMYDLADAHFNGRSAGTLDELKASMWLAEKFRSIGLKPAGDDGTYFQFFSMWRNHFCCLRIRGYAQNG